MCKKIYCIGDSHASFFSGYDVILPLSPETRNRYPIFEAYRLGATLAYNMKKYNTSSRGKERFLDLLETKVPQQSTILMIFGEIDCRVHIVKQAIERKLEIREIVKETVNEYFDFILEIKSKGYEIMLWNVVPTSCSSTQNKEYPNNGTLEERTQATICFNENIKILCNKNSIRFVSIYNLLVDERGVMKTKYFKDGVHLSQNAMTILLRELNLSLYYYMLSKFFVLIDIIKTNIKKLIK
jgi:hypothetical protein